MSSTHLNTLKQQEIHLKLKDEQIKKYEDLLLTYKSTRFDDCFLIYSYDEDQENVEIIAQNIMEFTELAYDRHYLLIARKEINRNVAINLMPFEDDCQLESAIDAIELLIDSKRKQQEEDNTYQVPKKREMEMINKILVRTLEEYERKIKEQEDQLKDYVNKTQELEQKIGEQTSKIEEYEHQLKEIGKVKEEQIRKQVVQPISSDLDFQCFLNEKNYEITLKSAIIDGLANRLFNKEKGDSEAPPLKHIYSLKKRRNEVVDFIEFTRTDWNNPYSGTDIQKNILNWLYYNMNQFLYNPTDELKENTRKMWLNKFKLKNTIGTIHFLPIQYIDRKRCFCFAISNYRIFYWNYHDTAQLAYSALYNNLKNRSTWTNNKNSKFATEMEVNKKQSDTFIHTSNKDVFVENEKVVTWMKNNFDLEQQNNEHSYNADNIPLFYNFIVNFYNTSSI